MRSADVVPDVSGYLPRFERDPPGRDRRRERRLHSLSVENEIPVVLVRQAYVPPTTAAEVLTRGVKFS